MPRRVPLRIAFCLLCTFVAAGLANAQTGGYPSSLSVAQGDSISFYLSTFAPTVSVSVSRISGDAAVPVLRTDTIAATMQIARDSAFYYGCQWSPTFTVAVPMSWQPGVYRAVVPEDTLIMPMIFVVRALTPGRSSRTLVCLTTNTWEAYNNWGGKSLYNYNSSNKKSSVKVSFDRPFSAETAVLYERWTDKLIRWMNDEHLDAEYCTNKDLDRDPHLLDHYDVYCIVGHDEYWSRPERNEIQSFVDRGGRLIVLSGNTCWWQVRFENDLHTLVCWRDPLFDPYIPDRDSIATVVWSRTPLNDPPNPLLGANFEHGGYVNDGSLYPDTLGYGGYTAYRTTSWIYENTGLKDGDVFGQAAAIVGYECDGVDMKWQKGFPVPTGADKTPDDFYILGISPESDSKGVFCGEATMGYMTNLKGGAVFNAASTNWVNGLDAGDSDVRQITHNIFTQFRERKPLPPEIVSYSPATLSRDSIVHQAVILSHRTIEISADVPDVFQVQVADPLYRPLRYFWTIDNRPAGNGPTLTVTSAVKQRMIDQALVSVLITNGPDTLRVNWTMIDTVIRFITSPPSTPVKRKNVFAYKPEARSLVDEHLTYKLMSAPPWLKMSRSGEFRVECDTVSGSYPVVISASDRAGHTAKQVFTIFITDTTQSERVLRSGDLLTLVNYPNPFVTRTLLAFSVRESSSVTIDICNSLGSSVRRILTGQALEAGTEYDAGWDGTDDNGGTLPPGIYFCRCIVDPHIRQSEQFVLSILKD